MPNTSSSVPFLLSSSMQSIRSRRTSNCLSSGPLGSGSGLLQQLGSGMVRQLTSASGAANPLQQAYNGNRNNTYVRKCPSLNITFTNWNIQKWYQITIDKFVIFLLFKWIGFIKIQFNFNILNFKKKKKIKNQKDFEAVHL